MKLVHLVGFITKKFCYDARSHVTMHGHMNVRSVTYSLKNSRIEYLGFYSRTFPSAYIVFNFSVYARYLGIKIIEVHV